MPAPISATQLPITGTIACVECGKEWTDLEKGWIVRKLHAGWRIRRVGDKDSLRARLYTVCPDHVRDGDE